MTKKFFVKVVVFSMVVVIFSSVASFAAMSSKHAHKIGILSYLGTNEESFQESIDNFRKFLSPLAVSAMGTVPEMQDMPRFLQSFRDNKYIIKFYDSLASMLMAVESGRADEISLPESTANYVLKNDPSYRILLAINMPSAIALGFRENDTALCEELNKVITAMKEDGTLKAFEEKYIKAAGTEKPAPVEFSNFEGADTIKVAVTGDMPPIDYISEEGKPAGYNTAVLSEIGRRLQKNIELINIEAGARSAALSSERVDIVFWYRTTQGVTIPKEAGLEGENPLDNAIKDKTEGVILSAPYYEWNKYLVLIYD